MTESSTLFTPGKPPMETGAIPWSITCPLRHTAESSLDLGEQLALLSIPTTGAVPWADFWELCKGQAASCTSWASLSPGAQPICSIWADGRLAGRKPAPGAGLCCVFEHLTQFNSSGFLLPQLGGHSTVLISFSLGLTHRPLSWEHRQAVSDHHQT